MQCKKNFLIYKALFWTDL